MTATIKPFPLKLNTHSGVVDMSHGSGGRAMAQLISELFHHHFANELLAQHNDFACFEVDRGRMVMSTDAHVVSPIFFPGGDIGSLAVHGTVNDVAMSGAKPLYLTASFILEEGFPLVDLERIVISMGRAAQQAQVKIIAGDTKVVERGKADGIFISTTGVGVLAEGVRISGNRLQSGDAVLINGCIGDHGMAVMAQRHNLQFASPLQSDSAALHDLVAAILSVVPEIHCLRDPTRGGLATTLNELAQQSNVAITIEENNIPIKSAVAAACELLGLDPLYVANEGKLVCMCAADQAQTLLQAMQQHPLGKDAAIIGYVEQAGQPLVKMKTVLGGLRVVDWLSGEPLPRIC